MAVIAMPLTVSGSTSEIADFVNQERAKSYELLQKSNALGLAAKGTFQQVDEIFDECSSEGWDGANAKPISQEVLQCTRTFLQSFPLGIEAPEVGAEPDGAITLEWYRSANKVISISINPGGWTYYAALIGATRWHGVDFALFGISDYLLDLISQITKDS